MCRFVFYRGAPISLSSLVTEPAHSIIHQSYHSKEREEPLNGDGFGVGWYAPEESDQPAIFKDITPAWNNQNLANLAPVVRSSCIVAHIRAATPGLPVSRTNCHPFSWGQFVFAHNGEVGGFHAIRRQIQSGLNEEAFDLLKGTTDSEHLFALFANSYGDYSGSSKLEAMASALVDAMDTVETIKKDRGIEVPSLLNLVLTDGESAVITRYASPGQQEPHSLYVHTGSSYECVDGICHMRDRSESGNTVLVASEPLSHDDGWRRVTANSMCLINKEAAVEERPIRFS
jgi:ergothioneine biosynthesis protein EgtC